MPKSLNTLRGLAGPLVASIVLAAVLAALQASGLAFWQGLFVNIAIFVILVVSLNLSNGFTGVFSLGHVGFMALGAYISAILTLPLREKQLYLPNLPAWLAGVHLDQRIGAFPLGFLLATIAAAALVSVVALLVGLVLMRLSGHFVAVATLGFLVIVRVVLINADNFTRGSRTFSNVTPYTNLWWAHIPEHSAVRPTQRARERQGRTANPVARLADRHVAVVTWLPPA